MIDAFGRALHGGVVLASSEDDSEYSLTIVGGIECDVVVEPMALINETNYGASKAFQPNSTDELAGAAMSTVVLQAVGISSDTDHSYEYGPVVNSSWLEVRMDSNNDVTVSRLCVGCHCCPRNLISQTILDTDPLPTFRYHVYRK